MGFQKVCDLDELWEGDMDVFDVGDKEILLVHLEGGKVVATQNICPHQNFELVEGSVSGTILTRKAHLWQFDLNVCKGINPKHSELAQYPIEIRGEEIYVDPSGDEPKYSH